MLLPHPTSIPAFSSKPTLISFPLFFPSPNFSSQNPKPSKFKVYNSSPTEPDTQSVSNSAFKRIADKLRSLGYVAEQKNSQQPQLPQPTTTSTGEIFLPFPQQLPNHRVGHTIDSSWSTPLNPLPQPGSGIAITRFHKLKKKAVKEKKFATKVPTLAELKLSEEELKRLKTIGIQLKKRLNVGKAGITEGVVNGIHERWRKAEVVKMRFEDLCKMNMQRTHDTLERKTGGLVIWRSGATIILYRGVNYKYPYFLTDINEENDTYHDESVPESRVDHAVDGGKYNDLDVRDAVNSGSPNHIDSVARSSLAHGVGSPNRVRFQLPGEAQLAEEADLLLEGLGPRFTEWWGYDPLPVDGDLLASTIPGYRRPFRLLPYGIKPKLTDDEMTTLRRLSRPLPCHFALGRNRRLHGLALSMVKLWEKCEIAKVAIKRGVSNTNSELMAEELKWLTGGTLLSRDKEFIVFYRGKDFLPAAVSTAIEERRKHGMRKEEPLKEKTSSIEMSPFDMGIEQVASDDELQETIRKNRELLAEKRQMKLAESRIKKIRSKLSIALEKKEEAEKLLADLEEAGEPQISEVDKEGITEEERYMLKKVGLRMKAYLPLGRRGIFAGTVENMHLHWKYRELVKILASERSIEDVHTAARTLEAESGGVLIAVERVKRDYAIIVYRGKNYQRPVELRPRTLLNKRQAMQRSIEAQRRESLKLHVLNLNKDIDQWERQLDKGRTGRSDPQPNENTKFEITETDGSEEFPNYEKDASSTESTCNQESYSCMDASSYSEETIQLQKLMDTTSKYVGPAETEVRSSLGPMSRGENLNIPQFEGSDRDDGGSTPSAMKSVPHSSMNASSHSGEIIQLHKLMDTTSKYVGPTEIEATPSSESKFGGENLNNLHNEVGDRDGGDLTASTTKSVIQAAAMSSVFDNAEAQLSCRNLVEPSLDLEKKRLKSAHKEVEKDSNRSSPLKAAPLSNRDRLLLRKQALTMKKRPVLAVGRNNIITGVAKTIMGHFEKNPLAIVNVKGRAEGTSIQEVVHMLEQATGAVLVSQETNKVILYRGWGLEVGRGGPKKINRSREPDPHEVVSPQLMEAIRLECGLQSDQEE